MMLNQSIIRLVLLTILWQFGLSLPAQDPTLVQATEALERAVHFYQGEVSIEGGYLWRYTSDFSEREGEVPASSTTAWVQPPGTPTVGQAFLTSWQLTGNELCREAARQSGLALVKGQLVSGGWDYRIEFTPGDRKKYAYLVDSEQPGFNSKKRFNVTTLDDNTSQSALQFLMRLDRALNYEEKSIHRAVMYALEKLQQAQYPNGAWPQRFSAPPDPKKFPVKPATYPEHWSRTYPKKDYRSYYTFNDNTMSDMIETMFLAAEIYGEEQYDQSGRKAGDFLILAQMPEPQPGWAQQYNSEMQPSWARKFEPPAVTGAESQGVMRSLMKIFQITGDKKYLAPLPRALAYYKNSILPEGKLARFYELRTNRPLYFTTQYELTYDDNDLPTHYGFKTGNRLEQLESTYLEISQHDPAKFEPLKLLKAVKAPRLTPQLSRSATNLINRLDDRGAWVESAPNRSRSNIPQGTASLSSRTFATNLIELARCVSALQNRK